MAEPFRFTWGRWYNRYDPETERYAKAPAYHQGFSYSGFEYGGDYPEQFTPDGAPVQVSLICSPQTGLAVIDVDEPAALGPSETGQLVSWNDAISTRGSHFHIGVDMRDVPRETWPVQGRTPWGDIKTSGFVAAPGSVHYSGEPYAEAPGWQGKLVRATPALLAALEVDKVALAETKRAQWSGPSGALLPSGAYLYSSGLVRGTWNEIPDGGLHYDDELKDLLWDMHVMFGLGEDECRQQWFRLAGALSSPWTERDFARHWRRVPAARLDVLEQDDAVRLLEDFGLQAPPTPVEAVAVVQQQVYQERQVQGGGFGPPTPPQPDGAYEDEGDGIPWFHYYLGATPDAPVFDAGRPTDAGNADAVLRRAWQALRHDEEADTWLKRTGTRWVQDDDAAKEAVTALLSKLPEGCAEPLKDPRYEHLDPETDAAEIAALKRHGKNQERFGMSATVNSIAAMMKNIARARLEPWMTIRDSAVDAAPEVLWAAGVPWNLKASGAYPVRSAVTDRNLPHLHSAGCVPDASVPTPLWDALLDAVWPPVKLANGSQDRSMQTWAVLVLSAGVTGYPKKAVPLLKGGTDRGKSTVVDAIADVLGTYFRPLNSKILDAGASTHDTVLMELKGTRLTFLDEGIQRGKVATARLKRLVGGSSITANRMRQDPVTFRPTHTLAITLNPEENFSFEDPAIDSRIRMLPCNGNPEQVIAVAKQFSYYQSPQWLKERPGVLAKLMAAAAVILNDNHALDKDHAPAAVQVAEQLAKDEEDAVLRWFLEATEDCPDGYPARELYKHFRSWTEETSDRWERVPTETMWGRRMNELIPDDHPDQKPLLTANKSKLRRRKPLSPGSGGFGGSSYAGFMGYPQAAGTYPQTPSVRPQSSVVDLPENPPEPTDSPADSPESLTRGFLSSTVSTVSTVSNKQEDHKETPPLNTVSRNGTGETHRPTGPTGTAPGEGGSKPLATASTQPGGRTDSTAEPDFGENGQISGNRDSPPARKTPRTKLTDDERRERDRLRKAAKAQEKADAQAAKIAELGGPLVQLPAVVLRDGQILPVSAAQAEEWLTRLGGTLGVDVEHTGYPIGHPDYALRLVQIGNEGSAVVLDPSDADQGAVIVRVLARAKRLHAHSAHADLTPLVHAGLGDRQSLWAKMTDTVIMAKLTDPALTDSDEAALKPLTRGLAGEEYALSWRYDELRREIFKVGGWLTETEFLTPVARSGWAQIPVCEAFVRYSASDVMDCCAVARILSERS